MTRITFGLYRKGVREPATTLSTAALAFMPPTPMPTASAAIAKYHRLGPDAALRAMRDAYRNSSYWGSGGSPQAGWANAMVECFERYIDMAAEDGRVAFATSLKRDVDFGLHQVAVHVDVVLLDPAGYIGRIVLWDKAELTMELAGHYATPAYAALEDELGANRVVGVEVWHLRSGVQVYVTATACESNLAAVERIVERIAQ